ncbi:hypothetical protein BDW69DRAFT_115424 [Aspergillus filifer]
MWHRALRSKGWSIFDEPLEDASGELLQERNKYLLAFREALAELARFYISRARAVFCPVMASANYAVQTFRPNYILVEDASFITEVVCLNATARHDSSAAKIILSGNYYEHEAPIFLTSLCSNEFYPSESISLIQRLLCSNTPQWKLRWQPRMSRNLYQSVIDIFYPQLQYKGSKVRGSPLAAQFRNVMKPLTGGSSANVHFFSVGGSSLWRTKRSASIFHPEYVCHIVELV